MFIDPMLLAGLLALTSLIAVVAWWHDSRLWWASFGVLVTAAVIVLSVPIIHAGSTASGHDPVGSGFGEAIGFFLVLMTVGLLHVASFVVLTSVALVNEARRRLDMKRATKGLLLELELDVNDTRKFPPPTG